MTLGNRRKTARITVTIVVAAGVFGVLLVEVSYRMEIRSLAGDAPPAAIDLPDDVKLAVWASYGENGTPSLKPLMPWSTPLALVFRIDRPDARISAFVARDILQSQGFEGNAGRWKWAHWATTVWITRKWSTDELTTAVLQRASFRGRNSRRWRR